jgi:hypothetical protein
MLKSYMAWLCSALAFLTLTEQHVQAQQPQIVVTIDDPGVQASTVSGATTETFSGYAIGKYNKITSVIGTYTSPGTTQGIAIVAANQYGGAGGSGNYFAIGAESGQLTATLALPTNEGYFGFWFSAGDSQNVIQLYENSTLEYTLNTANLISFINARPDKAQYYGNPNGSGDASEPFAYVNFFGTNNTFFNTVVFSNMSLGTGFESDNHSIGPESVVSGIAVVPEPSPYFLLSAFVLTGAGFLRRRRAR